VFSREDTSGGEKEAGKRGEYGFTDFLVFFWANKKKKKKKSKYQ
jgi:hypothetical protein